MTDCGHDHDADRSNGRRLLGALAVIGIFMVVEVVGGVLAGSLALIADAAHMLTDAIALALAASAHWLSQRPADRTLHFGYRRTQVLAAFVNGVALIGLLIWIVVEAVTRAANPIEVSWRPMLVIASFGLLANFVAYRLLHGGKRDNINIRGAMVHVAADMLGSGAAVIAALVIAFTGWMRIDPLLSILVAGLIARSAYRLVRDTGHILLEGAPANINVDDLVEDLVKGSPHITNIHSVRIWQLTPDHPRLTLHARVNGAAAGEDVLASIKLRLEERYGIFESTIQIECADCPDLGAEPSVRVGDVVSSGGRWRAEAHGHSPQGSNVRPQTSPAFK